MTRGRLQLEWHAPQRSLELEFESPAQVRYLKWSAPENVEEEDVLSLNEHARVADLIAWFEKNRKTRARRPSELCSVVYP